MATTGDRIREIREKLKMTQDHLANLSDISKGFLSDVENNKRNISSQALLRISIALGASVDFLLTGDTKESSEKEPIIIPPELSRAAEQSNWSYGDTLELLEAYKSIVARRSQKSIKAFTSDDWKKLHTSIKKVFG